MNALLASLALFSMGPLDPSDYVAQSTIVTAGNPFNALYATPRGVGYDATVALIITKPTGSFICSGSLVGYGRTVVTAAHCLVGATSVNTFIFPPAGGTTILTSTQYVIHGGYTGAVVDENDIALLTLPKYVTDVTPYGFYEPDALGEVANIVGFGASGSGLTGAVLAAGTRRQAWNRFDFYADDPTLGGLFGNEHVLMADFDSGNAAQDATCRLYGFFGGGGPCGLGQGALEGLTAGGDSGGSLLVGGRLAAVTSFGLTFSRGIVGDIDGVLNSSFGEFAGFVPIALHRDWLAQYITPEPATILLMATGLLALALMRRRRLAEN
ncbi:MAG: trypsin-like serine protease [Gemmatimonadales bacterium]